MSSSEDNPLAESFPAVDPLNDPDMQAEMNAPTKDSKNVKALYDIQVATLKTAKIPQIPQDAEALNKLEECGCNLQFLPFPIFYNPATGLVVSPSIHDVKTQELRLQVVGRLDDYALIKKLDSKERKIMQDYGFDLL